MMNAQPVHYSNNSFKKHGEYFGKEMTMMINGGLQYYFRTQMSTISKMEVTNIILSLIKCACAPPETGPNRYASTQAAKALEIWGGRL